jgi:GNAT superfamily N-acetyltransferase
VTGSARAGEWGRDGFTITTDPAKIDRVAAHAFLTESYWAQGVPRDVVDRSIDGSLCFALFDGPRQIGFARAITDRATFAYLADVYVLDEYRGRGLGKWLVETVMAHPDLQGLRRWMLVTRDAHGLYEQVGFTALGKPERVMEIVKPDIYKTR